jgi:GTP-binding protein LepA
VIVKFYDQLKNISSGFASMSYQKIGYKKADLEKIDVVLSGTKFEGFTAIVPKEIMQKESQNLAKRLKEVVPRQMFEIAIQVVCGGKILARENIPPLKKDVIAKLYGGDITRKKKLLEKQKSGKNKMKTLGHLQLPGDVYLKIIKG